MNTICRLLALLGLGLFGATGCDLLPDSPPLPPSVERTLSAAQALTPALAFVGILPEEGCGDAAPLRPQRLAAALEKSLGCATVSLEPDSDSDRLHVRFPPQGCWTKEHLLTGEMTLTLSAGDDRLFTQFDLRHAQFDGHTLPLQLGYEVCGDAKRYSAVAEGASKDFSFRLDLAVTLDEGPWPWSRPRYGVDGMGALTHSGGTDSVTFEDIRYKVGNLTPHQGTLRIETSDSSTVEASFDHGEAQTAEVQIHGRAPVRVSLPTELPLL